MQVFVAGGSGVLGRRVIPGLIARGHTVVGTTRDPARSAHIEAAGGVAVVVDAFDGDALRSAVVGAHPEVVVHLLTDLAAPPGVALDDARLLANARLREVGTANLLEAAAAAGARRVVVQSIGWLYAPGPEPHDEDDPLLPIDDQPTRRAVHELERRSTTDARFEGIVLRFGRLWGPDTWDASRPEPPVVHVDDAAAAAVLAVDRGAPGVYYVAEDGGPVSSERAKRELGWSAAAR
jgi:nucleoside-diphosphate-sugar epimerase